MNPPRDKSRAGCRNAVSLMLGALAIGACQQALTPATPSLQMSPAADPQAFKVNFSGNFARAGVAANADAGRPPVATIVVDPGSVVGPANSHLLGTCRNHVDGLFPNGDAKLAAMRELMPNWGDRKYLYRIGHGITDGRTDYSYMMGFHFEQCWDLKASYPYDDLRTSLDEAQAMGADQLHVVNFGTSDPAEAARYVSFLNHAGDANRAAHPCAQQNVQLFEIGNEVGWHNVRGHDDYAPNETTYADRAKTFARAMRLASDVPIKIGAVASINSNWSGDGWHSGAESVRNILATMGQDVDFLVFHGYPSWPVTKAGSLASIMAQNEWNRRKLEEEIKPAIAASGQAVGIANTEFFTNQYNDSDHARGLFGALYAADSVILAMNEQLLACVEFCFSHGAVADSGFFFDDDPARPTPIYAFQHLLARHWGDAIVKATQQGIPSQQIEVGNGTLAVPLLASTAATSADGTKLYMLVLDRSADTDLPCRVEVGFQPSKVTAYTLSGPNGWDSTSASLNTHAGVNLGTYVFKAATITILEIER